MARQQLVEVAKVLARRPAAIIFDEPTAVLPSEEADRSSSWCGAR